MSKVQIKTRDKRQERLHSALKEKERHSQHFCTVKLPFHIFSVQARWEFSKEWGHSKVRYSAGKSKSSQRQPSYQHIYHYQSRTVIVRTAACNKRSPIQIRKGK